MNRYDRYPGDYLRDTVELSMAEDGAYTRLLDWYYANERPIPDERKFTVSRAVSADEQKITQWVLDRFFKLLDGAWCHDRADREIGKARQKIETARLNGQLGGRPRKKQNCSKNSKPKRNPDTNPEANPNVTQTQSSPSPSPSRSISDPSDPRRVETRQPADSRVREVFGHWVMEHRHGKAKLDAKRRAKIQQRLRDGFDVDQLKTAISNAKNDPFLMGENDRGARYDDLTTLLRDAPIVERLITLTSAPTTKSAKKSEDEMFTKMMEEARFG